MGGGPGFARRAQPGIRKMPQGGKGVNRGVARDSE